MVLFQVSTDLVGLDGHAETLQESSYRYFLTLKVTVEVPQNIFFLNRINVLDDACNDLFERPIGCMLTTLEYAREASLRCFMAFADLSSSSLLFSLIPYLRNWARNAMYNSSTRGSPCKVGRASFSSLGRWSAAASQSQSSSASLLLLSPGISSPSSEALGWPSWPGHPKGNLESPYLSRILVALKLHVSFTSLSQFETF